ncbi:hypothetical protein [Roseibium sp. Sym1]|nr:hypothetical protein [Roseibium sp. Sym1]
MATQDPLRQTALVMPDKARSISNFHTYTIKSLKDFSAVPGHDHPE